MGLAKPKTKPSYTFEEYLEIDRETDERYEYLDGEIYLMAGESGNIYLRKVSENISKEWIFNTDELSERELKIVFVYSVKIGKNKKNIPKEPTYKVKFKKPYRLEITATAYSVWVTDY